MPDSDVALLIGTRKGAWIVRSSDGRQRWSTSGPFHLGATVHHLVLDPRDGATLLMALRTGHLGPTVFRSRDWGETWEEAKRPPAFGPPAGDVKPRAVNHVFWLTPGHASEPEVWYAGTSPGGLFRSADAGLTWDEVTGFNHHPDRATWTGPDDGGTPDGPKLHSILVDSQDAKHLYIGLSSGGVFESLDRGESWTPLNHGIAADFLPEGEHDYGHDPHCLVQHPAKPERIYQQNHCGIYRIDRPETTWIRIGETMPKDVGDVGFGIEVDPRDPDTAFVFPMDGTDVWPRISPGGRPAVYRTRDAGASWERCDAGFPSEQAWFSVKRQGMAVDGGDPLGVYLGTTHGSVWASLDGGDSWAEVVRHLPHVYSLEAVPCGS